MFSEQPVYNVMHVELFYSFFTSQTDAQRLFESRWSVPPNVELALTPDFYRFTPAGSMQGYGSTYVRRVEETKEMFIN